MPDTADLQAALRYLTLLTVIISCEKDKYMLCSCQTKFSKILTFYFILTVSVVRKSLSILYPEHT